MSDLVGDGDEDALLIFYRVHVCICSQAELRAEDVRRLAKAFGKRFVEVILQYQFVRFYRRGLWDKNTPVPLSPKWGRAFRAYEQGKQPEITLRLMARAHILDDLPPAILEADFRDGASYDRLLDPILECYDGVARQHLDLAAFVDRVGFGYLLHATVRVQITLWRKRAWRTAEELRRTALTR